jgi:hypothetical protein
MVDILFLPPVLICSIFCWRSRNVLLALRRGFNNKARMAILYAVFLVITDIFLLPFLLVVLSPLGWIFQRARPLSRQLCRRASAYELQESTATREQIATATIARSSSDRTDIVQLANTNSNLEIGAHSNSSDNNNNRGITSSEIAVALDIKMKTSEWYALILRQFFLLLADILLLPCTIVVFVTRWRWHSLEVIGRVFPITEEGRKLENLMKKNQISQDYNKHIDRDSGCLYHCWVFCSTLIVIHDIFLVLIITPLASLSIYRFRRCIAILVKAASLWRTTEGSWEVLYDKHDGLHPWRKYMWKQFIYFFTIDIIGISAGLITCIIAPHRMRILWNILKVTYKHRNTPWCPSKKMQPPPPQQEQQTNIEMKGTETKVVAPVLAVISQPRNWPDWNGKYPSMNGIFEDGFNNYEDGCWFPLVMKQFCNALIDLPCILAAVPIVVTIYRLDKLLVPMLYNRRLSLNERRLLPFKQCFRLIIDLLCLPLFFFVVCTLYRCFPSVKKWFSKRSKPCLHDESLTTIKRMKIRVNGVSSTVLEFIFRIKESQFPIQLNEYNSSPQLRIMGMSSLWKQVSKVLGNTTSSLAQAYMPYTLGAPNSGMESEEIAWSKVNNKEDEYDVKLRLTLPMKKSTIMKKMKLLAPNDDTTMNLQVEIVNNGKRCSLFSIVFPLKSIFAAASTKTDQENNHVTLGDTVAATGLPSWWNNDDEHNKYFNSSVNYNQMQSPQVLKRERGTARDYTDMRDSFSLIFFQYFVMVIRDLIHLALALVVMCVAPWRFAALLYALCEPKKRWPVRIASKLVSKIHNACEAEEEEAYKLLVLYANEHSKQVVQLERNKPDIRQYTTQPLHSPSTELNHQYNAKSQMGRNIKRMIKAEKLLLSHNKQVNTSIQKLLNLTPPPPYMSEIMDYLKLRDQRLHFVALNCHINRARLCNMFPPNILQRGDTAEKTDQYQEHEAIPALFELSRNARIEHEQKCQLSRQSLLNKQLMYEKENLKPVKCKKYGCWHKSEDLSRNLVLYMLGAGLRDWCYIILQILLFATFYKLPSLCGDLSTGN